MTIDHHMGASELKEVDYIRVSNLKNISRAIECVNDVLATYSFEDMGITKDDWGTVRDKLMQAQSKLHELVDIDE